LRPQARRPRRRYPRVTKSTTLKPDVRRGDLGRKRLDPEYAHRYICAVMQQSVFQTLADPTRFRIVEALAGGEQAVGDLVRAVDIDQSGVSRHLRILSEAGFVAMRPDGAKRLYSLRPEPFRAIDDWLRSYGKLWEGRLDRFDAALGRRQGSQQPEGKK
jgi:DNA-binding transcriptional ArsR family regulator